MPSSLIHHASWTSWPVTGEKCSLYLHCQLGPHDCVNITKQTLLNSCPPSPISQFHQPTRSDRFRNWPLKSCFIWIFTFSADLCPLPIPPSYLPPGFQEDPADFWLMLVSLINRMGTYFCKSATVCSGCIPQFRRLIVIYHMTIRYDVAVFNSSRCSHRHDD